MAMNRNWIDRVAGAVSPQWQLRRLRARITADVVLRNYDGAAGGRRTQGWRRTSTDAVQSTGPYLGLMRDRARDLVRNNPYAESALDTIVAHVIGDGIVGRPKVKNQKARDLWNEWAKSTACDADGRQDLFGLQQLVMRGTYEGGEMLVRRRFRQPSDGFKIPMQLQVLEPDFLDTSRDTLGLNGGKNRIVQGVEFDAIGRRVAYYLFPEHPGSSHAVATSVRVPAENVLHIYRVKRAGQVRGVSQYASTLLRFKDHDDLEDATLMKQKVAACLAVITSDTDGSGQSLGTADTTTDPQIDSLEPGAILNIPAGRDVHVVDPPSVREYPEFSATILKSISTGLGITYEDMTGDYAELPFSAAKLSSLKHWAHVEEWRWKVIVPQFCDPVWAWFWETAQIFGTANPGVAEWTAPPAPMIDPVNEGLAYMRNRRAGLMTLGEILRERGYDPETVFQDFADENELLDKMKLIFDSDPRIMTQAGQLQGKAAAVSAPVDAATAVPGARYQVQTTYGYYPTGRWGYATSDPTLNGAIAQARNWEDTRVVDRDTGEVLWQSDGLIAGGRR